MSNLHVGKSKTRDHLQFAAFPFRDEDDGRTRIMLLTSRETRRLVIPKGWPMRGRKPHEVAAQEALEEAGLLGTIVGKRPIRSYHHEKQLLRNHSALCEVVVLLFLEHNRIQ